MHTLSMHTSKSDWNRAKKFGRENKQVLSAIAILLCAAALLAFNLPQWNEGDDALAYHSTHKHRTNKYNTYPTSSTTSNTATSTGATTATADTSTSGTTATAAQPVQAVTITPQTSTTNSTSSQTSTDSPTNSTSTSSDDAGSDAAVTQSDNGLGIAAGGGLIYMGQEELDTYFQQLKDLGVSWVRFDVDWGMIQPDNAQTYDWEATDRVADTAQKYGIHALGIVTFAPRWAQSSSCPSNMNCAPTDFNAFAQFAGIAAKRYAGKIDAWEVWNEPNYFVFWYPMPDANAYARLLKLTSAAIRQNNPQATVLTGGFTNAEDEANTALSQSTMMKAIYAAGGKDSFDAVALHPYDYPGPSYSWRSITSVLSVMDANSDSAKPMWITEYGAPTGGSGKAFNLGEGTGFVYGKDFMTETAQDQMVQDLLTFIAQHPDRIAKTFWYNLQDKSATSGNPEDHFGLLRYDGSAKPAYDTIQKFYSSLGN